MATRKLEKDQESSALNARRSARQAIRKHHRAELMVPFLTDINFVIFWPHCFHAHPELYEQWDANNIIMIGREEIVISEDKVADIFYAGDAPLNEASLHKLKSGPVLAICFRLLNADVNFVFRRILYEEVPPYDETQDSQSLRSLKTAFDRYKTYSPSKEDVWRQRREEEEHRRQEEKKRQARFLSETRRLAREAALEASEAKKKEKEQRKLELLKTGAGNALVTPMVFKVSMGGGDCLPSVIKSLMPRWSSGRKCDCRTRGLGFDSRVGQSTTGLFSVFRKFLSGTESGIESSIWQYHLLHGTYNTNGENLTQSERSHWMILLSQEKIFQEDLEEEEEEFVIDENEYFPPAGLLIPGFYAPPNDIAKANGLAVLFPKNGRSLSSASGTELYNLHSSVPLRLLVYWLMP
uniref:SFRICE_028784 n=1 Tax=Spodoptera frugiperda TaxID=7108 RepID=A0A2H1W9V3_SPOFR